MSRPLTSRSLRSITGSVLLVLFLGSSETLASERLSSVAVFPVENLSGARLPVREIRQLLLARLSASGLRILPDDALDAFTTRHRLRYSAGVDAETAQALRDELRLDAVLIASVEFLSATEPPKVALLARLVSLEGAPEVIWADDSGLAGDDTPGLLDLGLERDYRRLLERSVDALTHSLTQYIETGKARTNVKRGAKFRPTVSYRSLDLEPRARYSVAVLPFVNLTERRNAGNVLALLLMRHLSAFDAFRVIDTGEVRQQLLRARIIMEGGVSIADAELVGAILEADFVLAGRVIRFEDYEGPEVTPRVEFSTVLIERKTRRVVWSSHSDNAGTDGVSFFGLGRSSTAHIMATQMARFVIEQIAGSRQ